MKNAKSIICSTNEALELLKQGKTVEDTETLDRFVYETRDDDGSLFIYQYNKHYGYEIDNEEFLSLGIRCRLHNEKYEEVTK